MYETVWDSQPFKKPDQNMSGIWTFTVHIKKAVKIRIPTEKLVFSFGNTSGNTNS